LTREDPLTKGSQPKGLSVMLPGSGILAGLPFTPAATKQQLGKFKRWRTPGHGKATRTTQPVSYKQTVVPPVIHRGRSSTRERHGRLASNSQHHTSTLHQFHGHIGSSTQQAGKPPSTPPLATQRVGVFHKRALWIVHARRKEPTHPCTLNQHQVRTQQADAHHTPFTHSGNQRR
jgi:hypothetical protein